MLVSPTVDKIGSHCRKGALRDVTLVSDTREARFVEHLPEFGDDGEPPCLSKILPSRR